MSAPEVSVVIPVYNEEEGLPALFARLYPALDALGRSYEIVFVNDGSVDRSAALLREQFQRRPDVTRVVLFNGNFGQHLAIMAGFEHCHGQRIVTLDADLQNPPEEIGRMLAEMDRGFDYVGTIRRHAPGHLVPSLGLARDEQAARAHHAHPHDRPGLHAAGLQPRHRRCHQRVPARSTPSFRRSPTPSRSGPPRSRSAHEERAAGESKYSLYKLIRLNFDLVTAFSLVPLQMFSFAGIFISLLSVVFVVFLAIRRLIVGPEAEGLFTLFGIAFFLIGIALFGIGLLGEYVGRIYEQVRHRPRFLVQAVLEREDTPASTTRDRAQLAAPEP